MGVDDFALSPERNFTKDLDPESVPTIAWGLVITVLAFVLAGGSAAQIGQERPLWALFIGVILPLGISLGYLMPFGLLLILPLEAIKDRKVTFFRQIGPWMAGWILTGMIWMGIAGAGSVIYQSQPGLFDPNSIFLISIFATYGAIPGGITGYYYGRTAQSAAEIAERERYLAVFSRVLRHNFRNEMNMLLGQLDLASQNASSDVDPYVQEAAYHGRDLMQTVEKQRFLVETVTEPKSPSLQTLGTIVETALESIQPQYTKAEIQTHNVNGATVLAHPAIDRAIAELLENAIQHTADEQPRVLIEGESDATTVTVTVTDSGPAIPPTETDILSQGLEPDQLRHSSGLGLWIVDRLTEQSNGRLDIERTGESGNSVSLTLPAPSSGSPTGRRETGR